MASPPATFAQLAGTPLRIGPADTSGPLAVFPVFSAAGRAAYRPWRSAAGLGGAVRERDGAASVRDLVVANATGDALLVTEGELLFGGRQDRVADASVLVAARTSVLLPVSCVEAGRWSGPWPIAAVVPGRSVAPPALRRQVAAGVASHASRPGNGPPRADQCRVWEEVARMFGPAGVTSATASVREVLAARRAPIARLAAAIPARPGQTGAVATIGGRIVALDWVSRPEVFAALHGPLVAGYAHDALDDDAPVGPPGPDRVRAVVDGLLASRPTGRRPSPGLGDDLRLAGAWGVAGALAVGGRLVTLAAFPASAP